VAGKRKCAVVSGGNLDAGVLAALLQDVRPRPPRKPRQRRRERLPLPAAKPPLLPAGLSPFATPSAYALRPVRTDAIETLIA
jgi:threonine dehydratase